MSVRRLALIACAAAAVTGCQNTDVGPGSPSTAPPRQWAMPDLVGRTLQDAQDQIQSITGNKIFITTSHDATGQHRNQVLDSNWKVCSQNIAAGAPIAAGTKIDFGAVKLAEPCP
jgi:hypothetical protein